MNEVELLLHRAEENIKAARLLAREELHNIAASRAYYAMFYIAEGLLLSKGLAFKSHSAVIAAFGKEFALTRLFDSKFHRYLLAAFDARQVSDYGLEKSVGSQEAFQMIDWAEEFLKIAQNYLREVKP